jgi:hypothetical protein
MSWSTKCVELFIWFLSEILNHQSVNGTEIQRSESVVKIWCNLLFSAHLKANRYTMFSPLKGFWKECKTFKLDTTNEFTWKWSSLKQLRIKVKTSSGFGWQWQMRGLMRRRWSALSQDMAHTIMRGKHIWRHWSLWSQ